MTAQYTRVAPAPGAVHHGAPTLEGVVGETMTFRVPDAPAATLTGAVVSAPAGSSATWSGGAFAPDVPGRYELTLSSSCSALVPFSAVAFVPEALEHPTVATQRDGSTRAAADRRRVLRALAQTAGVDWSALTAEAPLPAGVPVRE